MFQAITVNMSKTFKNLKALAFTVFLTEMRLSEFNLPLYTNTYKYPVLKSQKISLNSLKYLQKLLISHLSTETSFW